MENELLNLNVSNEFILNNNEENIDLSLNQETSGNNGSVTGTVYDTVVGSGTPVSGATVKVFTSDGIPYAHTITAADGTYTIDNLPIGMYLVAATKEGYTLSLDVPLTVSNTIPTNIDLAIIPNVDITKNIIYGRIRDNATKLYLGDVEIQLLKEVNGEKVLISSAKSISDGEYILDNIDDGNYIVTYVKTGYQSIEMSITLSNGIKFLANESMTSIIGQINNTVSGIIKDTAGNIIANALVALYRIDNGNEVLVATTYTNALGKYMFGNVVDGNYLVKSKYSA